MAKLKVGDIVLLNPENMQPMDQLLIHVSRAFRVLSFTEDGVNIESIKRKSMMHVVISGIRVNELKHLT